MGSKPRHNDDIPFDLTIFCTPFITPFKPLAPSGPCILVRNNSNGDTEVTASAINQKKGGEGKVKRKNQIFIWINKEMNEGMNKKIRSTYSSRWPPLVKENMFQNIFPSNVSIMHPLNDHSLQNILLLPEQT